MPRRRAPSEAAPWARQPGESLKAYEAFSCYRDMEERSLAAVARALRKSKTQISRWSVRWSWLWRVDQWSAHVDAQKLKALEQEREKLLAREREVGFRALQVGLVHLVERVKRTEEGRVGAAGPSSLGEVARLVDTGRRLVRRSLGLEAVGTPAGASRESAETLLQSLPEEVLRNLLDLLDEANEQKAAQTQERAMMTQRGSKRPASKKGEDRAPGLAGGDDAGADAGVSQGDLPGAG